MIRLQRVKQLTVQLCAILSANVLQSAHVSVEFLLADNSKIVDRVSPGAFTLVDKQVYYDSLKSQDKSGSGMQISPSMCLGTAAHAVESIKLTFTEIQDKVEYAQFRSLCSRAYPDENSNPILKEMQLDQFFTFLCAANYIGICGPSLKCFAQRMVKYGLLGVHDLTIIKELSLLETQYGHDIIWSMLLAFLECMEFQAMLDLSSTEPSTLVIEKGYSHVGLEWDSMPQNIKKAVLKHKLPKRKNRKRYTNEKILAWFLEYLGCRSLHLEYFIEARSVMNCQILPNLQKSLLQKYNHAHMKIYIEHLKINLWSLDGYDLLQPVFKFYESLSSLIIKICIDYSSKQHFSILAKHFSLCKSLKKVTIISSKTHGFQVIKEILENTPNIELLSINCQILPDTIINILANCPHLTKLYLYGKCQSVEFFKKLAQSVLSNLTNLELSCINLPHDVAYIFKEYPKLRTLRLTGNFQCSNIINQLLDKAQHIQSLCLHVENLGKVVAHAIRKCKDIKNLVLSVKKAHRNFFMILLKEPALEHLRRIQVSGAYCRNSIRCIIA
ncbi:hypothetical protein NECID01_0521 [Nematocida sp. AWRm77]|nr:hypothetical protein NECID01_0521 [Nematocida sp. AWRm77]